jgi:transcriptional regulator with XRE-family HTH domain
VTPSDPGAGAASPAEGAVGVAVREQRVRRQMSTRALAAAAGISQPFLTNVENGRVMPSIASLYSIAGALGVPASALLPEHPIRMEIVRAGMGQRLLIREDGGGGYSEMLSGARGRALESYLFDLPPGFEEAQAYSHEGEDFVHVLAGSLIYRYEGQGDVILEQGDSVWIDGRGEHTWSVPAAQDRPTRLLLVTATAAGHSPGRGLRRDI